MESISGGERGNTLFLVGDQVWSLDYKQLLRARNEVEEKVKALKTSIVVVL